MNPIYWFPLGLVTATLIAAFGLSDTGRSFTILASAASNFSYGGIPAIPSALLRSRDVDHWATISLARPLFSASRSPDADTTVAPRTDTELPRLSGVLIAPSLRLAFFNYRETLKVIGEGSSLGDRSVRSIRPGEVTLSGPEGFEVLRPSYATSRRELTTEESAVAPVDGTPRVGGQIQMNAIDWRQSYLFRYHGSAPTVPAPEAVSVEAKAQHLTE